jgi:hypothetical protein
VKQDTQTGGWYEVGRFLASCTTRTDPVPIHGDKSGKRTGPGSDNRRRRQGIIVVPSLFHQVKKTGTVPHPIRCSINMIIVSTATAAPPETIIMTSPAALPKILFHHRW